MLQTCSHKKGEEIINLYYNKSKYTDTFILYWSPLENDISKLFYNDHHIGYPCIEKKAWNLEYNNT